MVSKYATKYHYSPIMANLIGRSHKLGKTIGSNLVSLTILKMPTSSTSNNHDKFNENIDIESKESIYSETSSSTNSSIKDATDDLIETQPMSKPHRRNMLDTNVTVDYDAHLFETPRKTTVPLQQAPKLSSSIIHCNFNTMKLLM